MLRNIRTASPNILTERSEVRTKSNRLMKPLLNDSHMKSKMSRLNWQGNAGRSEYEKILPGEQPIRFQNKRYETPYFTWSYDKIG